jgi:hypothetical protein
MVPMAPNTCSLPGDLQHASDVDSLGSDWCVLYVHCRTLRAGSWRLHSAIVPESSAPDSVGRLRVGALVSVLDGGENESISIRHSGR